MHTLRKLPTARPRMANIIIRSISTGVYCGRITGLKSIGSRYWCRCSFFCLCYDTIITMVSPSTYPFRRQINVNFSVVIRGLPIAQSKAYTPFLIFRYLSLSYLDFGNGLRVLSVNGMEQLLGSDLTPN